MGGRVARLASHQGDETPAGRHGLWATGEGVGHESGTLVQPQARASAVQRQWVAAEQVFCTGSNGVHGGPAPAIGALAAKLEAR